MGRSRSVKFLLEQERPPHEGSCVNCVNDYRCTPLIIGVLAAHPKVVRLLIDAEADVTAGRRLLIDAGMSCIAGVMRYEQVLAMAMRKLDWKVHRGRRATEEEMNRLEACRRMLLRVDAIRTGSWLWCSRVQGVSAAVDGDDGGGGGGGGTRSAAPSSIAPIVRTRKAAGRSLGDYVQVNRCCCRMCPSVAASETRNGVIFS